MILFIADSFLDLQMPSRELYFKPQLDLLASEGIHQFEIIWNEGLPLAPSAEHIREAILRSSAPVILIAHGKGGLDTLECLARYPEVRPRIRKFVCMQAPIWGTPVADYLTGQPFVRLITNLLFRCNKDKVSALEELSEMNRQVYMILKRADLEKVLSEVDIVTVGSSINSDKHATDWKGKIFHYLQKLTTKYAGNNDGLVPLQSTRIGNESYLELELINHLDAVTLESPIELLELTRNIVGPLSTRPSVMKQHKSAQDPKVNSLPMLF